MFSAVPTFIVCPPRAGAGGARSTRSPPHRSPPARPLESLEARRRYEALVFLLEPARERDAGAVAVLGSRNLNADREATRHETDGGHGGGQVDHARQASPEQLVGGRHALAVHLDRALVALALVVVREGGRGRGRAKGTSQSLKNSAHFQRRRWRVSLAASQSRWRMMFARTIRAK